MYLYGQKPIKVSYHPAKFAGKRHFGRGDNIFRLSRNFDMMASAATA